MENLKEKFHNTDLIYEFKTSQWLQIKLGINEWISKLELKIDFINYRILLILMQNYLVLQYSHTFKIQDFRSVKQKSICLK